MNGQERFCCLLIRGTNLNFEEVEYIRGVYEEYGQKEIYEFLKSKKILPFAARTFCDCDIDIVFWTEILESYRSRNQKILNFLDKVYSLTKSYGIRKMFVSENFGALLSANEDIGLFASGDIDNYADVAEKEKLYEVFEELGCRREERFAGKHQIAAEFFPPKNYDLPEDFYISVDFYPLARLKLPCFVKADKFVKWDKVWTYKDTNIVLPPPDALMYICMLHVSLHSFSRAPGIRLYIDLLNMSKLDINYEELANWSRRDGTCTRVAVSAKISNKLMKTEFPDNITTLSKKNDKILRLVYDSKKMELGHGPGSFTVLVIEVLCDDKSVIHGITQIVCPEKEWMNKTYGSCGLKAQFKHIMRIL